jgi:predicted thioesterase
MDFNGLHAGLKAEMTETVDEKRTARALGSGGLEVYATPAMVALMEKAALSAVQPFLPAGFSTVGTVLNIKHTSASPLGAEIHAEGELTEVDGKRLVFHVRAWDPFDTIGEGTHERFIIDNAKFMAKTGRKMRNEE